MPTMLKYVAFRLAAAAVERLPLALAYTLAGLAARIAYRLNAAGRDAAGHNMRHVLGPDASDERVDAEARRAFRTAALYYVDLLRMGRLDPAQLDRDRVIVHGFEHLTRAVAQGRGVVICSAHVGSPELAVQVLAARGIPVLVLTEPLQPPALSRFVDRLRSKPGHRFRPANFETLKEALRTLRAGGVIAVMFDRDIQGHGIVIDLCGAPASAPTGAVHLAMRTGAALVPVFTRRRVDQRLDVTIEPALELTGTGGDAGLRANIEALFARFIPHLRADPGQWMVLKRVWDE